MSFLPVVSARRLLLILLKAGFKILRQKGSHVRIQHPVTKRSTTVALHAGDLSRKMILKILKQAGITVKKFLKLLGK